MNIPGDRGGRSSAIWASPGGREALPRAREALSRAGRRLRRALRASPVGSPPGEPGAIERLRDRVPVDPELGCRLGDAALQVDDDGPVADARLFFRERPLAEAPRRILRDRRR